MNQLIKINGFLYYITTDGRLSKNWKKRFYTMIPDIKKTDKCKSCNTNKNLTRHHDPPLRHTVQSKIIILCEPCHRKFNFEELCRGTKTNSPFSVKCNCGKSRYFLPKNKIQCKYGCYNTIHLKEIKEREYKII